MKTEDIKIAGMTCSHCKAAVEKSIKSLTGIIDLKILLEEGKAQVSFDESKVSLKDIRASIEEAGYAVKN
ncbi:MAG: copper ion binding protein [Syntrophomonas sp.]|nr:copper ion binding protein [Syntrophomonas sp.]